MADLTRRRLMAVVSAVGVGFALDAIPEPASQPSGGKALFDGQKLDPWKAIDFAGGGEPRVEGGHIVIPGGERLSGISWGGPALPKQNYELSLEASRVDGSDFFCGLTFPFDDSFATLVCGGWGGTLCGISSLNDDDASENETKSFHRFDTGKWYRVRLRVTPGAIAAWIDDKQIVDVKTTGKKVGVRNGMEPSQPLGITTFQTQAEIKNVELKTLGATTQPAPKQ